MCQSESPTPTAPSETPDATTSTDETTAVCPESVILEFIRQDNSVFPDSGDDACHMVSNFVTNVNLPDTATFDGPPGSPPDPDTFRVQVRGLPAGQSPQIRVTITSGGATNYTHTFPTLPGTVGSQPAYRINEHLRLVSNAPPTPKPAGSTYDDEHRAHQTILVKLGDTVQATLILGGADCRSIELPVARPPAENGRNAIRTADINFVTLRGATSDPAAVVRQISEDWAQVAIRYHLKSQWTVTPVTNVLTIQGTAGSDGQLTVDVTPQGGSTASVTAAVSNGDTAEQMAQALATAISAQAGMTATHHQSQGQWLVLVNKGLEVDFASINSTATGVLFAEPALNFNDDIDLLEGNVLGLNFKDNDPKSIDMIGVGNTTVWGGRAAAGGRGCHPSLPGWANTAILKETAVNGDDSTLPFTAGHEMGHVLYNVGNSGHSTDTHNLFKGGTSTTETLTATKRLTNTQQTDARTISGPTTTPGLLQKK